MPQLVATHKDEPLALFRVNNTGIVVNVETHEVFDPKPVEQFLSNDGWTTDVDTVNVTTAWGRTS